MPPKVISGGDNPYDIHDAKLSSSATAHESSSVTAHEISNSMIFGTTTPSTMHLSSSSTCRNIIDLMLPDESVFL